MLNKEINIVKLGDILSTSFTNGIYKSVNHYGSGVFILRITDFDNDGHLVTEDLQRVELSDAEVNSYKLQSNDIVVNRVNSLTHIGKSILWKDTENEITVYESNMMRIRPKDSIVLPEYLINILHSYPARNHYKRVAKRAIGQSSINQQDVKSLLFFLPSLAEQQKIANILSTWDKAISTTERLIDNSTQQKKALMQQLLTGKKRLLDESGKRFEGEWNEVKLSAVAQITMGSSPKSEAYNEVGDGLPLLQGNADIKNRKSVPRIYTSQITKECHVDDILLSVRAPVGTVAISNHHACIGRGIAAVKAKKNCSQDYLYQWLLSFETNWERYSQGSTFEAVNSNDIKSLNLSVPNLKEQQKIATVLTNADKEIELLQQQLADLQQEKKALMQVLLTGKERVVVEGDS